MTAARAAFTDDGMLGGRLVLRQPVAGHRFGHDAVLLAAATPLSAGDHVVDLGSGVGAAGLAVAARGGAGRVDLVEIDLQLVAMAQHNARANALSTVTCHGLDVAASASAWAACGLRPGIADRVMMNPPFHDEDAHRASPDRGRAVAYVAPAGLLSIWLKSARRLLRPGGTLSMILRADALGTALAALQTGFGEVRVTAVHPLTEKPAVRVVIQARKGSRAPLRLYAPVVLGGAQRSPALDAIFAGEALLPMAEA